MWQNRDEFNWYMGIIYFPDIPLIYTLEGGACISWHGFNPNLIICYSPQAKPSRTFDLVLDIYCLVLSCSKTAKNGHTNRMNILITNIGHGHASRRLMCRNVNPGCKWEQPGYSTIFSRFCHSTHTDTNCLMSKASRQISKNIYLSTVHLSFYWGMPAHVPDMSQVPLSQLDSIHVYFSILM